MLWLAVHYPALALEVFGHSADLVNSADADNPNESKDPNDLKGANDLKSANDLKGANNSAKQKKRDDKPRVVVARNRVWLANAAALQRGVRPGSTLATATTIAGQLEHHSRNLAAEQAQLRVLAEALYQLTPQIALLEPDALALDIQASLRLFGDARAIAERAVRLSLELGHQAAARLGRTPSGAVALARSGAANLEALPLDQLGLGPTLVERFANMGLHQLGQVLELPDRAIARRFGKAALDLLCRLRGDLPDPQRYIELAPEFDRTRHLLEPIRHRQGLAFPMQRLLQELKHWLIGQQLAVSCLEWHFRNSQQEQASLTVRFSEPQQSDQQALALSRLQLDRIELPADILSLELRARQLEPFQVEMTDLFQATTHSAQGGCPNALVDQLRARLGEQACCTLEVREQHHPDWQSRRIPVRRLGSGPGSPAAQAAPSAADNVSSRADQDGGRPLWLCRPPRPVAVEELTLVHGPERIRTAWWHQGICRDYYIARHQADPQQAAARCWAFVDHSGRWFIHGYFS